MTEQKCPDCGEPMERGFVPDFHIDGIRQMAWHRGEAERSSFLGIKGGLKIEKQELVPIAAHRCTGCGVLRLYAHEQDTEGF